MLRDKFYSAAETLYVLAEEKYVLETSTSSFMCIELSYQIDMLSYNVCTFHYGELILVCALELHNLDHTARI